MFNGLIFYGTCIACFVVFSAVAIVGVVKRDRAVLMSAVAVLVLNFLVFLVMNFELRKYESAECAPDWFDYPVIPLAVVYFSLFFGVRAFVRKRPSS
ncbi:hypothetical protein [Burkholderia contaminans]|uniref:hypothetical protein n=1 Tax=Burkholderia contaminans TaxID=488447 RepID=UPI000F5624F6|nr:hypothetical protein [Burkholderia contaminans]